MRTTVFMKGCPLHCSWCANPESQHFYPEVMCGLGSCIGCMECAEVCEFQAVTYDTEGRPIGIDRTRCTNCLDCAEVCYANVRKICGQRVDSDEVVQEVLKDLRIYKNSGGGVTFSGGEPLMQPDFCCEVAKKCRNAGIEVGIETCGYGRYPDYMEFVSQLTSVYFDIKLMNEVRLKECTGADIRVIQENLQHISNAGIPITIRTPVVPGCTDDVENIERIAEFIRSIPNVRGYELLRYHKLGLRKYEALNRNYNLKAAVQPDVNYMEHLVNVANDILTGSNIVCFYKP